mgnify:CR=1 FL=1
MREADPKPEWYAYVKDPGFRDAAHGISVFPDSFWLWIQTIILVGVVVVRRDVDDRELVAALTEDEAVQGFLRENADAFREVLREHEADLIDRGYDDVVRKAKIALGATALLSAGRREEEALPA